MGWAGNLNSVVNWVVGGEECGGKLCVVMVVVVGLFVYVTDGAPQSTTVRVGMSRAVRIGCEKLRYARGRLYKVIER